MKKIMLSAAVLAALIGTATAATTVTSANTVGYQEISLIVGFNMITPTFLNTGATDATYNIQDIKLAAKDPSNEIGWGGESIQTLDAKGNVKATYYWACADSTGTVAGWIDEDLNLVDVGINPGEGFLLYSPDYEITAATPMAIAQ